MKRTAGVLPKTIDEYLARLSDDKRAALEKLRMAIKAAAPKAEDCISYQIPAFRLGGRMLVGFGAAAKHCAFYPGAFPVEAHKSELKAHDISKGTIRFQADSLLPTTLVRKLVKSGSRSTLPNNPLQGTAGDVLVLGNDRRRSPVAPEPERSADALHHGPE